MKLRSILLGLGLLAAFATPARAQLQSAPIDLQIFRPAVDSKGFLTLNASQILAPLDFSFGLVTAWSRQPLEFSGTVANEPSSFEVKNLITPYFQAAVGLLGHHQIGLEVGVMFPLGIMSGRATPKDPGADIFNTNDDRNFAFSAQGAGDLSIHPKVRLANSSRNKWGVALIPAIVLPTGDKQKFFGEGQLIFQPSAAIDVEIGMPGVLRIGINGGARIRTKGPSEFIDDAATFERAVLTTPRNTNQGYRVGNELLGGLGVSWGVVPFRFDVVGEVYGHMGLDSKKLDNGAEESLKPGLEAIGGIKLYLARNSFFELGGGWGVTRSYGVGKPRLFVGFIFEPSIGDRDHDGLKDDVDQCPDDPEDYDDFEDQDGCPEPDNDKDRILDVDDSCPNDPETYNKIKDEDGCPDNAGNDRDGDGIPDNLDKCPDNPEDKDNFEDEDGCPDPDNDQDGILDVDDLCPNDPEDKDGFEDKDGCPDPDNDKDRILDKDDKCPNEPETYNGTDDDDGCPDKGRVIVRKSKIEILDKIYFETDKAEIKSISFPLLDAIAATIKGHPEILQIEIQGHADERGDDAHNLDLTDRRVYSVKLAIEERGVEPGRVRSKGYGEHQPICRQHNEECWSQNRRVEFIILKRATDFQFEGREGQ